MVNRRAFFEIFFYNRENRSREMMEAAESVWRAYMKKYGLGLDAGIDGQPTYDEVKEITYLANAAIEAVEKQIAEAEAEEARRKKLQREAWDLGIFAPDTTGVAELEALVMKAMKQQEEPEEEEIPEEPAEEITEEIVEEAVEAVAEEIIEEVVEEAPAEIVEEAVEVAAEEIAEEAVEEAPVETVEKAPVQVVPVAVTPAPVMQAPVQPVAVAAVPSDLNLWVQQLVSWCRGKGMQCITTMDEGDCYIHVYLPHKKQVHVVGNWCIQAGANMAQLAAEITQLYAYCEGFLDCFEKLIK